MCWFEGSCYSLEDQDGHQDQKGHLDHRQTGHCRSSKEKMSESALSEAKVCPPPPPCQPQPRPSGIPPPGRGGRYKGLSGHSAQSVIFPKTMYYIVPIFFLYFFRIYDVFLASVCGLRQVLGFGFGLLGLYM